MTVKNNNKALNELIRKHLCDRLNEKSIRPRTWHSTMSVPGTAKNRCLSRYTYTYVCKTSDSHEDLTTVTSGEKDGLGDRRELSLYMTVYCS